MKKERKKEEQERKEEEKRKNGRLAVSGAVSHRLRRQQSSSLV